MGNFLILEIHSTAKIHPKIFSAVWFAIAALLLTSPLIAIAFLLPLITPGQPASSVILFLLQGVFLPSIVALPIGAIVGSRILSLPSGYTFRAAVYGLVTGLATFIIWIVFLEVIPDLPGFFSSGNYVGDVPGAAVVLAYLVVLPAIVIGEVAPALGRLQQ